MTLAMPACSCSLRCSTAISPPQTPDPLEEESIESGSTWAKGYLVSEPDPPSREGSGSETKGYQVRARAGRPHPLHMCTSVPVAFPAKGLS